jgi:hypothetical protein
VSDRRQYTLLNRDGSIKSSGYGFPANLRLPQGEIPVKAMTYTGPGKDLIQYYLLVLDSNHNLWIARSDEGNGFKLAESGVLDFDVMIQEKRRTKVYFVKTDRKLYQTLMEDLGTPAKIVLSIDETREGLPKIEGLVKVQVEIPIDDTYTPAVFLFRSVF